MSEGCGSPSGSHKAAAASSIPTLSISGPNQVRAGEKASFSAQTSGLTNGSVAWSVNGIPQGNSTVGTISTSGTFTAPAIPPSPESITITCAASQLTASVALTVLNPIPEIGSASAKIDSDGDFVVDISGSGFTPHSYASFDGIQADTSVISASHLQSSIQRANYEASSTLAVVTNPDPGAEASNSFAVELPQGGTAATPSSSSLQQLVGCQNPNTGTANGDWGSSSSGVYINLTTSTALIGTPSYSVNSIFWVSRETKPGQSVLMTGAFTSSPKTARVAFIAPGTIDWQSLVQQSKTIVPTTQQGTTGLSFVVPSTFPEGVYGFEIETPSAAAISGLANQPSLSWVIGVPSSMDSSTALQHGVYDCSAEPGETLRIFGKNFVQSSQVVLQSSTGAIYLLTHRGWTQIRSPLKFHQHCLKGHTICGSEAPLGAQLQAQPLRSRSFRPLHSTLDLPRVPPWSVTGRPTILHYFNLA